MKKLLKRERKVKIGINLAPDLLKWVDAQAAQESRSRSRMIECMLDRVMPERLKAKNRQKPIEIELTEQQKKNLSNWRKRSLPKDI